VVIVTVMRAAERFEESLSRFPRARVLQVEMMLENEKRRTEKETALADRYRDENIRLRKVNHEIHDLYG
jgi:hypothetical protein